jgi:hypothetical protein
MAHLNVANQKKGQTSISTAADYGQIEATHLYLAAFTNRHDQICRMLVEA